MTGVKIVDASAVAAVLFSEPDADAIAARLQGWRLAAPSLLDYELANVCLVKIRRAPAQKKVLLAAYGLLRRLRVDAVAVDHGGVVELAELSGLTAYDASYLWLARAMGAELVTLNQKLAAAAAEAGPRQAVRASHGLAGHDR